MSTGIPSQLGPNQRRWGDLKLWRLGYGLVLAPVIPFAIATFIAEVLTSGMITRELPGEAVGILLAVAVGWSLLAGFAYLLAIVRSRGSTGRTECLLLGCGIAFALPNAVVLAIEKAPEPIRVWLELGNPDPLGEIMPYTLGVGLFLVPFGLFGGWIFWNAAIRPAPLPLPDLTGVFD